jgi:hypothetical protein
MADSAASPLVKKSSGHFGYYELPIFAFLLFELLILLPDKVVDSIATASYLITYRFGFISKAMIGSIFSLFSDRITTHAIYITAIVSFLFLILLISFLLGRIIRNCREEIKPSVIVFVLLFLSSPLSVSYMLGMYLGRFDVYWIIITLVSLVFLKKSVLSLLVPILCAVGISVHQGYMFSYMPALAIPIFYEVYLNRFSKRNIFILVSSCISFTFLFVYFQTVPAIIPFENAVEFSDYLSRSADFEVSPLMLHTVYFAPFKESYYEYVRPLLASYALPLAIELIVFSLPLLVIFGVIWKNCIHNAGNKLLKFIFVLCAFSPLTFIPIAFFLNDWDRYWAAVINTQFIFIFYFIFSEENSVIVSVKKVGLFFARHHLLLMLIIMFACSIKFSKTVTNMFSFVKDQNTIVQILEKYTNERVYGNF